MIKPLLFKKQAPKPAMQTDLAALETKLGASFPSAFVEFCARWNGGFPSNTNNFYQVPPEFTEFHDEYRQSKGIIANVLFGVTNDFPQCSLLKECEILGEFSKFIIPITSDVFGNHAVLRVDSPKGMVYWSDHELWEPSEDSPPDGPKFAGRPLLFPIAPDLETFYNSLTAESDRKQ